MDSRQAPPYFTPNHPPTPTPVGVGANNGEYESYTSTLSYVDAENHHNNMISSIPKASSSNSSSLQELTGLGGNFSGENNTNKILSNHQTSKPLPAISVRTRKQHTLGSLNNNKRSRTRSPIVALGENQAPLTAGRSSKANLFDVTTQKPAYSGRSHSISAAAACNLSPIERISIESFERRRSIYESEIMRPK